MGFFAFCRSANLVLYRIYPRLERESESPSLSLLYIHSAAGSTHGGERRGRGRESGGMTQTIFPHPYKGGEEKGGRKGGGGEPAEEKRKPPPISLLGCQDFLQNVTQTRPRWAQRYRMYTF